MIEPRQFRDALGRFGTGVTIVTTLDGSRPMGMTASSFASVSLDPPLVLFCPARTAESYQALASGGPFVINVLSESQQELSNRFARAGEDKWRDLAFDVWDTGVPVLRECLANLECDTHAVYDGGDHSVVVGRVRRLAHVPVGRPLIYFSGSYAKLG